jgi:hypothetical protein
MKPEYMVPGGPCAYCGGNHYEWDCKDDSAEKVMSEGRDGKSTDRLFRVAGLCIGFSIFLYMLFFYGR